MQDMPFCCAPPTATLCPSSSVTLLLLFTLRLHSPVLPLLFLLVFTLLTRSCLSSSFSLVACFLLATFSTLTSSNLHTCTQVGVAQQVPASLAAQIHCSDNQADCIAFCVVTLVNCSEIGRWPTAILYSDGAQVVCAF